MEKVVKLIHTSDPQRMRELGAIQALERALNAIAMLEHRVKQLEARLSEQEDEYERWSGNVDAYIDMEGGWEKLEAFEAEDEEAWEELADAVLNREEDSWAGYSGGH